MIYQLRTIASMWLPFICGMVFLVTTGQSKAIPVPEEVLIEESRRVEVVQEISKSTIAIFEPTGQSGGSGVLIDERGFALTNFHVTAPCGPLMTVGTSDGKVHQAVIVGIDPSGDIALIKLLGTEPYPAAKIGDSDQVQVGEEAIVAGNPFLLAEDFKPTITFGIISGTHRYQPPSGSLLEYTDCLQTDASINPGNSGGPLFNGKGELIGINGRGSFEKRGRVNVGIGYAVSINQVMRFLSHLKSGRIVDHASLGATVTTRHHRVGQGNQSHAAVDAILTGTDAYRRGLRPGDELLLFNDQEIQTANQILNTVGVCPPGWRIPIVFRRGAKLMETEVQLEPLHTASGLREGVASMTPESKPMQKFVPNPLQSMDDHKEDWKAYYEASDGFMNRHFNRLEVARLLKAYRESSTTIPESDYLLLDTEKDQTVSVELTDSVATWESPLGRFRLDSKRSFDEQPVPLQAPGLLAGLWILHQINREQESQLDDFYYYGQLMWRPNEEPSDVIRVLHRGSQIDLYFASSSTTTTQGDLRGFDIKLDDVNDPIRVEFVPSTESSEGDSVRKRIQRWQVMVGNELSGNYLLQKEIP